jgi:hypothetical protein
MQEWKNNPSKDVSLSIPGRRGTARHGWVSTARRPSRRRGRRGSCCRRRKHLQQLVGATSECEGVMSVGLHRVYRAVWEYGLRCEIRPSLVKKNELGALNAICQRILVTWVIRWYTSKINPCLVFFLGCLFKHTRMAPSPYYCFVWV